VLWLSAGRSGVSPSGLDITLWFGRSVRIGFTRFDRSSVGIEEVRICRTIWIRLTQSQQVKIALTNAFLDKRMKALGASLTEASAGMVGCRS